MNNLKRLSPVLAILGALFLTLSTSCGKKEPGTTDPNTSTTTSPTSGPVTPVDDIVKYCKKIDTERVQGRCKMQI